MKSIIKLLAFCLVSSLLSNCQRSVELNELSKLVNERMGDSIIFPASIYVARTDINLTKTDKIMKYKYTMVVYTDGDCGKCISDLYQWKLFLKKNRKVLSDVNEKFIIYSNNFIRFEYTTEKARLFLPYYYDSLNSYTSLNKIDDPVLYTLLLDNKNKIKLIGSPLHNPAMLKLYQKVLSESINDED